MDSPSKIISQCFVKPKTLNLQKSIDPYHLPPLNYVMISSHYIQKGLLFINQSIKSPDFMVNLLQKLKDSLASSLDHFYPLAGRLCTSKTDNPRSYVIFVDCNNSPGAGFIHAKSDLSVEDIVGPKYTPLAVQTFFDHHKAVNHDGHTLSLLSVKVTELKDGVFIGLSLNHAIGDGSSFWQFFNSWSEIFNAQESNENNNNNLSLCLKNPPILERWFTEGYGPVYSLPFNHPDDFIRRFESPVLKERIFHFSAETIKSLKSKVNQECGAATIISSFQSLSAVIWRCITRARKLGDAEETSCGLAVNKRSRMNPPLPLNYFGVCISGTTASTKVSDLLGNKIEWAALKLHEAVISLTSEKLALLMNQWLKAPFVLHLDRFFGPTSVVMGSSPRFNKYGSEFGMGKAVGVRSGYAHKFDGKVTSYPGREGGGSIDLEICLLPKFMEALESDHEFMSLVSPSA